MKKRTRSIVFVLINVVIWAFALSIVKPALDITTPFRYLLYRFVIAGILSLPVIVHFWPKIKNKWRTVATITLLEVIGTTLSLGLLYAGLRLTTSVEANLITTSSPILVTLFGIMLLHEHEEGHEWLGLLFAFGCTILISVLPILQTGQLPANFSLPGNLLILFSNVTAALYYVLAKKYYHRIPKFFATSVSYLVGIVTFFALSMWEVAGSLPQLLTAARIDLAAPSVLFATLYMATFGSIIALTFYLLGQDGIEASEANVLTYLQPLIALPAAVILLKEHVDFWQIVLLIGVFAGVYITEKRTRKLHKHLFRNIYLKKKHRLAHELVHAHPSFK